MRMTSVNRIPRLFPVEWLIALSRRQLSCARRPRKYNLIVVILVIVGDLQTRILKNQIL